MARMIPFCGSKAIKKNQEDLIRGKYRITRTFRSEACFEINKCVDTQTNQSVVVKTISLGDGSEGVDCSIIREVSLLKELEHDNIVRLLDVRSDENSVDLIFECLDSDLGAYMFTRGAGPLGFLNAGAIKNFLHQILRGISYCHSHKILHRNMKPNNLLIDIRKGIVKIADFGMAREVEVPLNTLTDEGGTLEYRAPEILLGSKKYFAAVDMWAVGCIFAEMVTRKPLFKGICNFDILIEIFSIFGVPNEDTWPGVTSLDEYISSTSKFPHVKSKKLAEVVTGLEPDAFDLLSRMLCLNPTTRITSYSALNHPYFKDIQNAP